MRNRSLLGLLILLLSASCVPPQVIGRVHTIAAHRVAAGRAQVSQADLVAPAGIDPTLAQSLVLRGQPTPPLTPAPPFTGVLQSGEDARRALDCLTAAVYYEARSEAPDGQRAVAQVVLNRVRNSAFPNSVCGVVYQGAVRGSGCQFTFTCDGSLLYRREPDAWDRARAIAQAALDGSVFAPVGLATYYHTTAVLPWWAASLAKVTTIGSHIFYRWRGNLGSALSFRQHYAGIEPDDGTDEASPTPDAPGVVRYAVGDGYSVTVHRGGQTAMATTSQLSVLGVRIHSGSLPVPDDADQRAADAAPAPASADLPGGSGPT